MDMHARMIALAHVRFDSIIDSGNFVFYNCVS